MADTCIVCLGDLATSDPSPPPLSAEDADPVARRASTPLTRDDSIIAHLLPCKHNLHNTCLKPWVERANSCPICRTDFNVVELKTTLNGPCVDSYTVQDKKQIAEFDAADLAPPLDLFDPFDDEEYDDGIPRGDCLVCQSGGDQADLLLCDGCNSTCHTYCCNLTSVPDGPWFCEYCHEDGTASLRRSWRSNRRSSTARLRQRLQGRGGRRATRQSDYTRIWQTILARTNIDLDFPFEDDAGSSNDAAEHRREMREWTRRFQIAERQGGAARFRETAGSILQARGEELPTVQHTPTREETQAWNAFEVARDTQSGPTIASSSRGTKRKSAPASPAEPDQSSGPERPLKRPRTRRVQEMTSSGRPSSTAQTTSNSENTPEPAQQGPSFLRQLLTEVENSSGPAERGQQLPASISTMTPRTDGSPGPPSPTISPPASNHPSPRLRSASPHSPFSSRPSSPSPGLTSRIEPIYVQHTSSAFSPVSPGNALNGTLSPVSSDGKDTPRGRRRESHQSLGSGDEVHDLVATSRNLRNDQSPSRSSVLSYDDKAKVQKMVSAVLKPLYHEHKIDTEQYTEINKAISRKMYDKIVQQGGLHDANTKIDLERVAAGEVEAAMKSLTGNTTAAALETI